jgi:glycerol kinase
LRDKPIFVKGLFAPYWRPDARGLIVGITQYTTKAHIARATLEAVAFQNLEIVESMNKDSGISLKELQVSGGMTSKTYVLRYLLENLLLIVFFSR